MNRRIRELKPIASVLSRTNAAQAVLAALTTIALGALGACGHGQAADAKDAATGGPGMRVGVIKVERKTLDRRLTVSSELVPFQEIDVYAKESGFVKSLLVDYGTRVRKGQLMAVLEIPELDAQLRQDDAMIRNASDRITRAEHELDRAEAQHHVLHLQAARLSTVAKTKPGLVAEQEVDDATGKDLAAESSVESSKANLESLRSDLLAARAKREHDGVLLDYARITAPFAGVVTQRFANLGMLMQAGTNSSTQAMPLVRLSQDDLFRLVIPVPESYVKYIHIGDPVEVTVSSLGRTFPGKFARLSSDVQQQTRTMHTEVDVPNPDHTLVEGLYAEAALRLEHKPDALCVPLQTIAHQGDAAGVLVVNASNRIEERKVQIGLQTDTDAEIVAGLKEGELVVASDRSGLKPGQEVRPQPVELLQYQGAQER